MVRIRLAVVVLILSALPLTPQDGPSRGASEPTRDKAADKPDPAATKLMGDTHDSWAHWDNFPGFSGNVEVNLDGRVNRGRIRVSPAGEVELRLDDARDRSFAREVLASIIGHRLGQRLATDAPCTFVDDVATHPLGRAVRVLGDDPGTSYRVRDREVIEVNRRMGDVRYTHIILENRRNRDGKHLTVSFVANMWDAKTGALRRTDTNHQTWERVGRFDLPVAVTRIRAGADNLLEVGTLRLSGLRLGDEAGG